MNRSDREIWRIKEKSGICAPPLSNTFESLVFVFVLVSSSVLPPGSTEKGRVQPWKALAELYTGKFVFPCPAKGGYELHW